MGAEQMQSYRQAEAVRASRMENLLETEFCNGSLWGFFLILKEVEEKGSKCIY